MRQVIGDILPFAVGAAISPFPIIAMVLMLTTARARVNGLAFLVGWILGLTAIGVIVLAIAGGADASSSDASDGVSWVKLGLGVLLLSVALRQWRGRPQHGEQPTMPKWMDSVESFTAPKALGAGVVLSAVNPKNLLLSVGAATIVAQSGISGADEAIAYAVFALIATIGVAVPLGIYFALGDRAPAKLASLREWLGLHNAAIMAVLCLVIGVKLIGDAIGGF
jgi:threonine/homoserine/homoserine lactone efflux protein